jgi:hypothetical protein
VDCNKVISKLIDRRLIVMFDYVIIDLKVFYVKLSRAGAIPSGGSPSPVARYGSTLFRFSDFRFVHQAVVGRSTLKLTVGAFPFSNHLFRFGGCFHGFYSSTRRCESVYWSRV